MIRYGFFVRTLWRCVNSLWRISIIDIARGTLKTLEMKATSIKWSIDFPFTSLDEKHEQTLKYVISLDDALWFSENWILVPSFLLSSASCESGNADENWLCVEKNDDDTIQIIR